MTPPASGRRGVVLVFALVATVLAGLLLYNALKPRDFYTGTNSVVGKNVAAQVDAGASLCVDGLQVPAGTGRVQLDVAPIAAGTRRLDVRVRRGSEVLGRASTTTQAGRAMAILPIRPRPEAPASVGAQLCVTVQGGGLDVYGLVGGITGSQGRWSVNGSSIPGQPAVWFLPREGARRSVVSQLPELARRAALFRPGWVGPWTYWVLILGAIPLLLVATGRMVVRALTGRVPRRAALALFVLVALNAAAWALITPSFDGPDEQDHYAYVQSLAERGTRPTAAIPQQRSAEETLAVDAVRLLGHSEAALGRPPWLKSDEDRLTRQLEARTRPRSDDGGGLSTAATHAPIYYGAAAGPYWLAGGSDVFGRLFAARLLSALLGGLTAVFAFFLLRELAPRQAGIALAGGVLVGFQPMLGFMAGVTNNDVAVNAACAALLWLLVRGLRRGLSLRSGLALGGVLALAPLVKFTALFLYPAAALALLGIAWRWRASGRRLALGFGGVATAWLVLWFGWRLLSGVFDAPAAAALPGGASLGGGQLSAALGNPAGFASYLWQVLLPIRLPFMTDLYVPPWPAYDIFGVRAWASFGWLAIIFPAWVTKVIFATMLGAGGLALVSVARFREVARARWIEALMLLTAIVGVLLGLELAFYQLTPRAVVAEQGRYMFTVAAALVAVPVAACFALGRRWAPVLAGGLVAGVLVLSFASQLLTLTGFYT